MNNRHTWIQAYGDLMRAEENIKEIDYSKTATFMLIIRVLLMLVEDKIKEKSE